MKTLSLQHLRDQGAFVDPVSVQRDVEWTHKDRSTGEEVTEKFSVHIRRHSFGMMDRLRGDKDRSTSAAVISASVLFGENADETMSYEEAVQLDPGLALELVKAVNEANAEKN